MDKFINDIGNQFEAQKITFSNTAQIIMATIKNELEKKERKIKELEKEIETKNKEIEQKNSEIKLLRNNKS